MQCEICGEYIDKGKRIRVEGSIVVACNKCAAYGEIVGVAYSEKSRKKKPKIEVEGWKERFEIEIEEELVDDYARIIKDARENRGLKQEELGKMINEPTSLIHRIEIGKIEPTIEVARKIQKKLGVRILRHVDRGSSKLMSNTEGKKELTLGDMIVIRKKNR